MTMNGGGGGSQRLRRSFLAVFFFTIFFFNDFTMYTRRWWWWWHPTAQHIRTHTTYTRTNSTNRTNKINCNSPRNDSVVEFFLDYFSFLYENVMVHTRVRIYLVYYYFFINELKTYIYDVILNNKLCYFIYTSDNNSKLSKY